MKKITLSLLIGMMSFVGFSQVGLVENFDAGLALPAGWTSDAGDYFGAVVQVCDGISLRANFDSSNLSGFLASPNIVGQSNGSDLTISFDYKIVDWSAGTDATPPGWGEILVEYSTNDGGAWTTIGTINDVNHATSPDCANISFVVPAASVPTGSDFKLRISNNYFSGNYYIYLDNISATQVVVDPPSCVNLITPANGATGVSITTGLEWTAASGIPTGYTLSVGTAPGGTDVVNNENVGLSTTYTFPADLDYSTIYYVTVLPFNGNGPAQNCTEFMFTTGADPNQPVDCTSGVPINTSYCYTDNETTSWNFQSSDGSPLIVFFNAGELEACCDDILIYDGTDNTAPLLYQGNEGGDMTGFSQIAPSGFMYIEIDSDGSISCQGGFTPLDFDVSCVDETALPNCNANLVTPTNGATDVNVATQITWTPASVLVTGYFISIGTTPGGTEIANNIDVGDVLSYTPPAILPYESTIYVTITPYNDNGSAQNCNEFTFDTELNPYQCEAEDQCVFTFIIEDSFGDGWNGNTMTVSQDGLEIAILGEDFTGGAGPIEYQIPLCDGIPFELYWNAGGAFAGEVSVTVINAFDDEIFNMPNGNGGLQDSLLFTDIVNCTPPTCPRPTDVSIVEINMNSVEVSWTPGGTEDTWEIIVQPLGSGYPDGTEPEIIQTMDNPYLYENLNAATQYEIYVRAICAADDSSDWEGPLAFDTTICDAVDQCLFTFILEDSFGDGWNGNTMTVSQNGIPVQLLELPTGSGPLEVQVPLCDGIPFELYWNDGGAFAGEVIISVFDAFNDEIFNMPNGNGGLQDSLLFSDIVNCTPPTCPRPDDITIVDVSPTSVEVSWTPGGAEDTWEIIVQPIGTGYPDGTEPEIIQTMDNPVLYENLTPGLDYEIYVRAICAADDLSDWEGPVTFRTPFLVDCEAGEVINTVHCYEDGINNVYTLLYTYQSSSGFPLNILFNSGTIETCCDTIRIEDGNGTIIYEGTGVGGDLTGLTFTSATDTLLIFAEADGSVSCDSGAREPWDFDVWCQTCIPQTVSFDIVNGDCISDPNNPVFEVAVDISDLGDATSLTITDNQTADSQEVFATGTIILGPYPASTNVVVTVANTNDPNCIVESNPLAFLCPPPPNPCSIVYAGEDTTIDCENPEATLTATYQIYGQDTNTYEINALDTCQTPPVEGGTPTGVEVDDNWSDPIDMGFEFCFFGETYSQVVIGANGVLSFDNNLSFGDFNGWNLDPGDTLPNNTNPTLAEANIFGVAHDINTETILGGCGDVNYVILGSAPSRQFVVNYNNVCHFGCDTDNVPNDLQSTTQIILYESSNAIDINIFDKPTCTNWNDGLSVAGIQNPEGTVAFTPPGRNTGAWSATNEFWRFTPSQGAPNYSLEWFDEDGNSVGDTDTVTVSPGETEVYTLEVTYNLCTGGEATISDEVLVEYTGGEGFDASFTVDPTCDGGTATVTGDTGGTFELDPLPTDTAVIDPATGTVTGGTPGATYTVQYTTLGNCPAIETQELTVLGGDPSFTVDPTCDGGTVTITGDTGGTFTFDPVPTDDAVIDPNTGEVTGGTAGETYTIVYTLADGCSTTSTQMVTVLSGADASFTTSPTCDGATVTITGDMGGTFAFNPVPTDTAVIDPATGEVTGGTPGATYTIEYTIVGACTAVETQTITVPEVEDASFTMTATCDGATATITGDTGGTFAFNPVPTDTAVIDPATGTVTGGTSGATYTVEYTTGNGCPQVSSQTFTVLPAENSAFTMTATCDGATATITGDTGGTFTFNPVPTDDAVIDPVTGTVTGGTSGVTYTVEYSTSGACQDVSSQTFTVLPQDDASFTVTATCDGATATIIGDTGGTFTFNPVPNDDAVIDDITGTVTNATPGSTYTVEYTTSGTCPAVSTQDFTVPVDDASFEIEATCGGAIVTILGTDGGTFAFVDSPDDGAEIDPETGEITGASGNTTYTISYTTSGACPSTSVESILIDNCIIPQVITPNNDGFNDTFDLSSFDVDSLEIFNRNGTKVYSKTNGYTNEFYGVADNGDELPVGTYFYVMKYQGGKVRTSWVYINK